MRKRVRLPGLASTLTRFIRPPRPGSGISSDMEASHTSNAEEIEHGFHGGACSSYSTRCPACQHSHSDQAVVAVGSLNLHYGLQFGSFRLHSTTDYAVRYSKSEHISAPAVLRALGIEFLENFNTQIWPHATVTALFRVEVHLQSVLQRHWVP